MRKRGDQYESLGSRRIDYEPGRPPGERGSRELLLTSPVELTRGMKRIVVKASAEKPVTVLSTMIPLTGRRNDKNHRQALPEGLLATLETA